MSWKGPNDASRLLSEQCGERLTRSAYSSLPVGGHGLLHCVVAVQDTFDDPLSEIGFGQVHDVLCKIEIQELIPHRYVPGKNHGKVEGKCYRWDRRLDAGGQEALLDELQHRTWAYTHERYETLLTEWDRHGKAGVYSIDVSEPSENNIHFVFSDTRALGTVRFRFFMKDCRAIGWSVWVRKKVNRSELGNGS